MKLYQILPTGSKYTKGDIPHLWEFPYHEARQKSQGYDHKFPIEVKQKLNLLIKIFISPNNKNGRIT